MKFVDEAIIEVHAGHGGKGCVSFLREKFVPKGGPDGGDGGDGGHIYLVGTTGLNTLADYRFRRIHRAENGKPGMGKERRGKSGVDLMLKVPLGTTAYCNETGALIGEVLTEGATLLVARGGYHGIGNARYKSSTNRTPRQSTPGSAGDSRKIKLELQVLADVGLLGFPNAGKSTLLSVISKARPKIADYPFTTLHPNLGVVLLSGGRSFVVADIPGVITDAHLGVGLGCLFLKHLERCKVLLHVVDLQDDVAQTLKALEHEKRMFSQELQAKPNLVVFTKQELNIEPKREDEVAAICAELGYPKFHFISSHTGAGVGELLEKVYQIIVD